MLFGSSVGFKTLVEAEKEWDGIAEEVEDVQYMEGARGRGRKRRRVTNTVKKFIARVQRYLSMADDVEQEHWMVLRDKVDKQYSAMLETKNVLNQELDNVW